MGYFTGCFTDVASSIAGVVVDMVAYFAGCFTDVAIGIAGVVVDMVAHFAGCFTDIAIGVAVVVVDMVAYFAGCFTDVASSIAVVVIDMVNIFIGVGVESIILAVCNLVDCGAAQNGVAVLADGLTPGAAQTICHFTGGERLGAHGIVGSCNGAGGVVVAVDGCVAANQNAAVGAIAHGVGTAIGEAVLHNALVVMGDGTAGLIVAESAVHGSIDDGAVFDNAGAFISACNTGQVLIIAQLDQGVADHDTLDGAAVAQDHHSGAVGAGMTLAEYAGAVEGHIEDLTTGTQVIHEAGAGALVQAGVAAQVGDGVAVAIEGAGVGGALLTHGRPSQGIHIHIGSQRRIEAGLTGIDLLGKPHQVACVADLVDAIDFRSGFVCAAAIPDTVGVSILGVVFGIDFAVGTADSADGLCGTGSFAGSGVTGHFAVAFTTEVTNGLLGAGCVAAHMVIGVHIAVAGAAAVANSLLSAGCGAAGVRISGHFAVAFTTEVADSLLGAGCGAADVRIGVHFAVCSAAEVADCLFDAGCGAAGVLVGIGGAANFITNLALLALAGRFAEDMVAVDFAAIVHILL